MRSIKAIMVILAAMAVLAGCDGGLRDLERRVEQIKQREAEPIEPIPPIRTPESFTYEAHDLRDPFRIGRSEEEEEAESTGGGDGPRPDFDRRKEYLEGFPLDTLDMVGTMQMDNVQWALIEDTDGVVHRVREGNYLGQNHGQVLMVAPDRVELTELVPDGAGGWTRREATIALTEG